MAEILQPTAGQTIVSTDNQHRHHGDDRNSLAEFIALASDIRNSTSVTGDRVNTGIQLTGDRVNTVGAATALASGHTDQLVLEGRARGTEVVQAGFGGVHDRLCDAKAGIVSALGAGFTAGALAECKTQDAIADVKFIGMETAKDGLIALNVASAAIQNGVNTGFAAQSVLATTIGNAQSVLSTSIGNAASVQATNYFNLVTVQTERVRAELGAKMDAGFAAATLVAFQNKADSDAKAAECCCAVKELIRAQTSLVLAQGSDFRMRDLEGKLVATQRLIPVTIPVGAG